MDQKLRMLAALTNYQSGTQSGTQSLVTPTSGSMHVCLYTLTHTHTMQKNINF